jgi:hypothetical protein
VGGFALLPARDHPLAMHDAQIRALLIDSLALWGVDGRVTSVGEGLEIAVEGGSFLVRRAPQDMRPVRWLLETPERRAANRPPRAVPSIVALLAALRNALGAEAGNRLRIGASAS